MASYKLNVNATQQAKINQTDLKQISKKMGNNQLRKAKKNYEH